jgi:hypothetical protein
MEKRETGDVLMKKRERGRREQAKKVLIDSGKREVS